MFDLTGTCGCGRPHRYQVRVDDKSYVGSCNKYRRCPEYSVVAYELEQSRSLLNDVVALVDVSTRGVCAVCGQSRPSAILKGNIPSRCTNGKCLSERIREILNYEGRLEAANFFSSVRNKTVDTEG